MPPPSARSQPSPPSQETGMVMLVGATVATAGALVTSHALDNQGLVDGAVMLRPFLALTLLGLAALALCRLLCPSLARLVPATLYLGFAYHVPFGYLHGTVSRPGFLSIAALGALLVGVFLLLRRLPARQAAGLNLLLAAVACLPALMLLVNRPADRAPVTAFDPEFEQAVQARLAQQPPDLASLPDILYVVPDRYGSATTLAQTFGHDNRAFYAALEARGFTVARDARANYPRTFLSLASSLNSNYLDGYHSEAGEPVWDQGPFRAAIRDNLGQALMRQLGYRYLHLGSWWPATANSPHADENDTGARAPHLLAGLNRFEFTLLKRSPVVDVLDQVAPRAETDCDRMKNRLERLSSFGNGPVPTYAFTHLMVPHDPALLNRHGRCRPPFVYNASRDNWSQWTSIYADYLSWFNRAFLTALDRQIEQRADGGRALLVVIQSDEGPFPRSLRRDKATLLEMSQADRAVKQGTINAIRLPAGEPLAPGALVTPINNWRIIMGALLETPFPPLPHQAYIHPPGDAFTYCELAPDFSLTEAGQAACQSVEHPGKQPSP